MARYEIRGPDGARYEITAPDDFTQDQVLAYVQQQFARTPQTPQQPAAAPAQKPLSWSEVPGKAVSNLGPSAAQFAKNMVTPFLEPVETLKGLAEVGKGVASKAAGLVVKQDPAEKAKTEAAADAVGQFFADRYGSLEAVKNTLATDPVGVMADASMVLSLGGTAVPRTPGLVGQVGNVVRQAGSALDPVANAGRLARGTGNVVSHVVGQTTGASAMPIQAAFQAGRQGGQAADTLTDAMRGYSPVSETVDMAESAVRELTRQRGDAYKAGITATKADQTVLNMAPIRTALDDALKSITYQDVPINTQARKAVSEVYRTIKRFDGIPNNQGSTAAGLDAMKQAVGGILEKHKPGTQPYRVVKQVYDAIGTEIRNQVPSYADTMRGYSQASDQIGELRRTFSINPNAAADTTARKLLSVTRNNVNTNYGERTRLFDVMAAEQPNLPYAVSGHALSSWTPRGLQGVAATGAGLGAYTNPFTLSALPFFSPRLMGEASYLSGRTAAGIDELAQRLRISPERLRAGLMAAYGSDIIANQDD